MRNMLFVLLCACAFPAAAETPEIGIFYLIPWTPETLSVRDRAIRTKGTYVRKCSDILVFQPGGQEHGQLVFGYIDNSFEVKVVRGHKHNPVQVLSSLRNDRMVMRYKLTGDKTYRYDIFLPEREMEMFSYCLTWRNEILM